jgi:hypothetical protein
MGWESENDTLVSMFKSIRRLSHLGKFPVYIDSRACGGRKRRLLERSKVRVRLYSSTTVQ